MKKILIIMPQFSPSSYPPSQRVRLFTNHLEEFGWTSIVLTVRPEYLEEESDWEYHKMISDTLEIVRTKAFPVKLTRLFAIGDLGIRSFLHLLWEARRICKKRKIDMVFIPGPPWHTFLIGPILKKTFDIPYVLDYIDPWVSSAGANENIMKKSYWFRQMAVVLEPHAIRHANHIISVSEGTNKLIRARYPFLKPEKFTAIPYGGETKDFEYVRKNPKINRFFKTNEGFFNFVYIGAMLPKAYDTLKALFLSFKELVKESPDLYGKSRIYFIGTTYATRDIQNLITPLADAMGLSSIIYEHPRRIPFLEAMTLLIQADAILALGSDETHYTASKIYPCILAKRPLLAIYHEASVVVEVIRETNAAEVITFSTKYPVETKVKDIKNAVARILDPSYKKPTVSWNHFKKYSARNMTKKLADICNDVTSYYV